MQGFDRVLWRCVDAIMLIAVLGMVALISLQVGSRLTGASVPWTEELSRFLFIWTVWLGLAASFRTGAHPALTLVSDLVIGRARWIFRLVPMLATATLFVAVTWYGYKLLRQQIVFGEQSAILQIGMWWSTLPLVLGAGLSVLGAIISAFSSPVDVGRDDSLADVERHIK